MGMLDGLIGQVMQSHEVTNLAAKVGLTPDQVAAAVTALTQAHPQPGDTVQTAADSSGLPTDKLNEVLGHLGGEGALTRFSSILNGQSGAGGMLGGIASSIFGKS